MMIIGCDLGAGPASIVSIPSTTLAGGLAQPTHFPIKTRPNWMPHPWGFHGWVGMPLSFGGPCQVCNYQVIACLFMADKSRGGWPTQAVLWLEWGSSTAGHNFRAARSRFRAVHSDSISTRPSPPAA
jgi:hypothetical protein